MPLWCSSRCLGIAPADFAKYQGLLAAITRLIGLVNEYEQELNKDQSGQSRKRDPKGRFLFNRGDGRPTISKNGQAYRSGQPLYTLKESMIDYGVRVDATNSGAGYTKGEIQEMKNLRIRGHNVSRDSSVLDDYLKKEENWHIVEHEPLMEQTRHKRAYIKHVKDELDGVRERLMEHKDGVDRRVASLQDEVQSHIWVTDDFVEPASQGLEEARTDVDALLVRLTKVVSGFDALPREEEKRLPYGAAL